MFIRTKKTPRSKSTSVQLVESFREHGKIKQRVVRHFGTAPTEDKLMKLLHLANSLKTELEHNRLKQTSSSSIAKIPEKYCAVADDTIIHASHLEESKRIILGIHDVYGYVYEQLGFTNLFYHPTHRIFSSKILREIVLARIAYPTSKRASVEILQEKFGVSINLDHVYQMMDKIDDRFCEKLHKTVLGTTLKLSGDKLRVLFYDATTLYFESFTEDDLKQNGYSKDMKFNQSQVLLALFVTDKGLPVGYELFPGATFEGHTLITALEKLKLRYNLEDAVFVADRGLFSDDNLKILEKNNYKYIVGARIKNLSKKLKSNILNPDHYSLVNPELEEKTAEFDCAGRRLIVNYSKQRAAKDFFDRQKSIEKLRNKLIKSKDPKSLLSNYGYKKYVQLVGDAKIIINESKLESDACWDGLAGVITNVKDLNHEQILFHYRGLWQVEESFRINKHDLKLRPIYHWTPHRVKAHIAISFMAFSCVRYLEYRVSLQSQKLSPEMIRKSLLQIQASILQDNKSGKKFLLPSPINPYAKEIYRVTQVKLPQRIKEFCNA